MNKNILTTVLLSMAVQPLTAGKLTMEEHAMQAVLQMQEAEKIILGSVATVGDDVACDFRLGINRIQDAIDSGADEVRIANSIYNENLTIDDISISLIGGYDNCTDASNDISNSHRLSINGISGSGAPTILITGDTQRNTVNLELLSIQNGEPGFIVGGGVAALHADLALNINNSNLSLNNGSLGGGLSVFQGNTDVSLNNILVSGNEALSGGGIFCSGTENSVFINDDFTGSSGVFFNQATAGDGGGIMVTSGCSLTSFSGRPDDFGLLDVRGVVSNTATGNGGGIAVSDGGSVFLDGGIFCFLGCLGDNTRPVNVDFNKADIDNDKIGFGGGIYASGATTVVNLYNANISDNAAQSGGGIAVENQATVNMRSLYSFGTCWSPGRCSQLNDNKTGTVMFPVRGGGLYATTGAVVDIANTMISGNRADFGMALYVFADVADVAVTTLDVEGALIVNNGAGGVDGWSDKDTIRINGGEVKLDYSTIADNEVGSGANIYNTGSVEIYSTIIHNTDGTHVYRGTVQPNGTLPYECLMVNESISLPAEPEIVVDDPSFIDRAGGNFHLDPAISPAIDFCSTVNASTPDFYDSDNEARGFDDPSAPNHQGPYDIGYDETYGNDIIYKDGFEFQ